MSERFGLPNFMSNGDSSLLSSFSHHDKLPIPNTRSRKEIKEDFEKKISEIDLAYIKKLRDDVSDTTDAEEFWALKEDVEDTLIKFCRVYNAYEELNSDELRKISLKENELKLEAKYDWRSNFRMVFFRVLTSVLLVVTLFGIGFIEHEFDWARLPLTKYFSPNVTQP